MLLKLFSIFAVLVLASSQCKPLYWEVDPTYNTTSGELNYVASLTIPLSDVSSGKSGNNHTISNISGTSSYVQDHETVR